MKSRPINRSERFSSSMIDAPKEAPLNPHVLEKDTDAYRDAVNRFFELSIPVQPSASSAPVDTYLRWLRSYSSYECAPVSPNKTTFQDLRRFELRKHYPKYKEEEYNAEMWLEYSINSHTAPKPVEPERMHTYDLRRTYDDVCKAVAAIELSASTLRTNSRALTLAKKLVTDGAFDIFRVLDDFRPPAYPEITLPYPAWTRLRGQEFGENTPKDCMPSPSPPELRRSHKACLRRCREVFLKRAYRSAWEENPKKRTASIRARIWAEAKRESADAFHERANPILLSDWERDWERAWAFECKKKSKVGDFRTPTSESYKSILNPTFWYDGLNQITDYRRRLAEDRELHPGDWDNYRDFDGTVVWQELQYWWRGVDDWADRRKERLQMVNKFAATCVYLSNELRKIDGSASTNDLNIFSSEIEDEDLDFIENHSWNMIHQMMHGNKSQFIYYSNELLIFIERKLRSNALKQGLETLIKKQDHFRNTFMDSAAVAIFFSSITATTLQFSTSMADESVSSLIVNLCWFASLILSIASATNSFLGAIVHQSPEYLRPSAKLDFRFLRAWFRFIPPMLLSMSGLLFLAGVSAFTFLPASKLPSQGNLIKHTTIALTSANALALLFVILLAFTGILHKVIPPIVATVFLVFQITFMAILLWLLLAIPFALILFHFVYCFIKDRKFSFDNDQDSIFATAALDSIYLILQIGDWCRTGCWEAFDNVAMFLKKNALLQFFRYFWIKLKNICGRRIKKPSSTQTLASQP